MNLKPIKLWTEHSLVVLLYLTVIFFIGCGWTRMLYFQDEMPWNTLDALLGWMNVFGLCAIFFFRPRIIEFTKIRFTLLKADIKNTDANDLNDLFILFCLLGLWILEGPKMLILQLVAIAVFGYVCCVFIDILFFIYQKIHEITHKDEYLTFEEILKRDNEEAEAFEKEIEEEKKKHS